MGEMRKLTIEEVHKVLMPFGKHKGKAMADLPIDYLTWLAKNCNMADVRDHAKRLLLEDHPLLGEPDEQAWDIPF